MMYTLRSTFVLALALLATLAAFDTPAATIEVFACEEGQGSVGSCVCGPPAGPFFSENIKYLVTVKRETMQNDPQFQSVRIPNLRGSLDPEICAATAGGNGVFWTADELPSGEILAQGVPADEVSFFLTPKSAPGTRGVVGSTRAQVYPTISPTNPLTITQDCDVPTILDPGVPASGRWSTTILALILMCALTLILIRFQRGGSGFA